MDQAHASTPPGGTGPDIHFSLIEELLRHLEVCQEAYSLVQKENQCLKSDTPRDAYQNADSRHELFERISGVMVRISAHKSLWMRLSPVERSRNMRVTSLIKQNMDLIMKTVVLDRENEKLMLQHGMAPPDRLPSSRLNNPAAVGKLYQQNTAG